MSVRREQPLPGGAPRCRPRGWSAAPCRPRRRPPRPRAPPPGRGPCRCRRRRRTGTSTASSTACSSGSVPTVVAAVAAALGPARHHEVDAGRLGARAPRPRVPAWTVDPDARRRAAGRRTARTARSSPRPAPAAPREPRRAGRRRARAPRPSARSRTARRRPPRRRPARATHAPERDAPTPIMPRPPAADTAAASGPSPGPAIGAPTTGTERPKVSVSQVSIIVPLWQTGRPDR